MWCQIVSLTIHYKCRDNFVLKYILKDKYSPMNIYIHVIQTSITHTSSYHNMLCNDSDTFYHRIRMHELIKLTLAKSLYTDIVCVILFRLDLPNFQLTIKYLWKETFLMSVLLLDFLMTS